MASNPNELNHLLNAIQAHNSRYNRIPVHDRNQRSSMARSTTLPVSKPPVGTSVNSSVFRQMVTGLARQNSRVLASQRQSGKDEWDRREAALSSAKDPLEEKSTMIDTNDYEIQNSQSNLNIALDRESKQLPQLHNIPNPKLHDSTMPNFSRLSKRYREESLSRSYSNETCAAVAENPFKRNKTSSDDIYFRHSSILDKHSDEQLESSTRRHSFPEQNSNPTSNHFLEDKEHKKAKISHRSDNRAGWERGRSRERHRARSSDHCSRSRSSSPRRHSPKRTKNTRSVRQKTSKSSSSKRKYHDASSSSSSDTSPKRSSAKLKQKTTRSRRSGESSISSSTKHKSRRSRDMKRKSSKNSMRSKSRSRSRSSSRSRSRSRSRSTSRTRYKNRSFSPSSSTTSSSCSSVIRSSSNEPNGSRSVRSTAISPVNFGFTSDSSLSSHTELGKNASRKSRSTSSSNHSKKTQSDSEYPIKGKRRDRKISSHSKRQSKDSKSYYDRDSSSGSSSDSSSFSKYPSNSKRYSEKKKEPRSRTSRTSRRRVSRSRSSSHSPIRSQSHSSTRSSYQSEKPYYTINYRSQSLSSRSHSRHSRSNSR